MDKCGRTEKGPGTESLSSCLGTPTHQKRSDNPQFIAPKQATSLFGRAAVGACAPSGMLAVTFLGGGYPVEFVQRPEQLTILYEAHSELQQKKP